MFSPPGSRGARRLEHGGDFLAGLFPELLSEIARKSLRIIANIRFDSKGGGVFADFEHVRCQQWTSLKSGDTG